MRISILRHIHPAVTTRRIKSRQHPRTLQSGKPTDLTLKTLNHESSDTTSHASVRLLFLVISQENFDLAFLFALAITLSILLSSTRHGVQSCRPTARAADCRHWAQADGKPWFRDSFTISLIAIATCESAIQQVTATDQLPKRCCRHCSAGQEAQISILPMDVAIDILVAVGWAGICWLRNLHQPKSC